MKKAILAVAFSALLGCSALTGIATDAVLGSSTKGMEVTAQVGKENNKGLVNTKVETGKKLEVDVGDVAGDAVVDSGNSKSVENDGWTMIGLVLAGMAFPMLLLFYMMPSPRWLNKRYKDTPD